MAAGPVAFGLAETAGFAILEGIFSTSPQRSISWWALDSAGNPVYNQNGQPIEGTIYPQVVLAERGIDQLRITQHPVEQGASVTDHAYKLPAQVQIMAGWSYGGAGTISPIPVPTDPSYLAALYDTLRQIQIQRSFVTLVTGKRTYTNMLMETLAVSTDQASENILDIVANFQEVLLATTQTVAVPDPTVMKNAPSDAATLLQGNTSLVPGTAANFAAMSPILGNATLQPPL